MSLRLLGCTGLLVFFAFSAGCAKYATIRQPRPALVNAPIRRLSIVELPSHRDEGRQALASLWSELQTSGKFELIPQNQLQQFSPTPIVTATGEANQNAAVDAGRRIGVDAVLIAKVRFLETDGTLYGTKTFRIGDPEIIAAVDYELIDVRSGHVLDKNVAKSEPYQGDLNPQTPGRTAETKVLSRLAAEGGVKVAHLLLPHENEIKVKLAHSTLGPGSSHVRLGTDAAQAGNWVEARQFWLQAVEANPKNEAAAYNLALAHEALGEFALARRALAMAADDNPNSLAKAALERVGRAEAELRLAQQSRPQVFAQGRPSRIPAIPASSTTPTPWQPNAQPGPTDGSAWR